MNDIFYDFIAECIMIVYLDDILIFTWILEEHHKAVWRMLKILAKYKLFLHPKKCKFDKQQIKYLGLVISQDQVEIDSINIAGVCDWPVSHTHTDLQVFLGFTNFY